MALKSPSRNLFILYIDGNMLPLSLAGKAKFDGGFFLVGTAAGKDNEEL